MTHKAPVIMPFGANAKQVCGGSWETNREREESVTMLGPVNAAEIVRIR